MTLFTKTLSAFALTATALTALPALAESTRLDIQSAWPLTMPASGDNAAFLGETLNASSEGDLDVTVYGAGKLVPSLQIFDAVQQGTLDSGITSPLYVAGRFPAVQLFGGIPFGPDVLTHSGWIYEGGGAEIWAEIYAAQGVKTIPCGLMDSEAGGWYNFEINTIDDFKGKKIRFAGLAGEAMANVGASIVLLPGGEIYSGMEKGIIDGTELSMPAIDITLGLQQVSKYYYPTGWHQPAAMNELIVNMAKWDSMSDSQRAMIEASCKAVNMRSITSTMKKNAEAITTFEEAGVEIKSFSPEVIEALRVSFEEVIPEQIENDADFKRVWESLTAYRAAVAPWAERK